MEESEHLYKLYEKTAYGYGKNPTPKIAENPYLHFRYLKKTWWKKYVGQGIPRVMELRSYQVKFVAKHRGGIWLAYLEKPNPKMSQKPVKVQVEIALFFFKHIFFGEGNCI